MIRATISRMAAIMMLVLVVVCFSGSMLVDAQDGLVAEQTIAPRAALCPDCGQGTMKTTYGSWGPWYINGSSVKCTHYLRGVDQPLKRSRSVTTVCTFCGNGASKLEYQTKLECHGYNK